MGGAVSSGESNDDLIDNLRESDYIKTPMVEQIFRAVDRAFYYTKSQRKNAYKDVAWKDRNLHLSAPCIYSEVMENLQLKGGMSFLNIGSGTGYLSTMAGLILGKTGINHGIEVHPEVVEYARSRLNAFLSSAPALDMYDFCQPQFVVGNCLDISKSTPNRYDRIYCGAACPENDLPIIIELLKIGGICIVPVNETLLLIQRNSESDVAKKNLLPVSFASLITPPQSSDFKPANVALPEWTPAPLGELCRSEIRHILRKTLQSVPKRTDESLAKKRKKKMHERRRANRLLVVQRRRNSRTTEGRENGFVAIAYSMGENSSEEENPQAQSMEQEENVEAEASSSYSKIPNGSGPLVKKPSDATCDSKSEVNSDDSGTESGHGDTGAKNENLSPEKIQQNLMEPVMPSGSGTSTSTKPCPLKTKSMNSSTVVENKHVGTNRLELANGIASSALAGDSASTTRMRTPTTESILNRIREIVQNRQMEREALRVRANGGEGALRAQVDDALREPSVGEAEEFQEAVNDENDELENECEWETTDSSTTTSSSSSDDDSDDYQFTEPRVIGCRGRRLRNLNSEGSSFNVNLPPPDNEFAVNDDTNDSTSQNAELEAVETGVEEPVAFHPVSLEMASKIQELPLPPPLKRYLNYQRDI